MRTRADIDDLIPRFDREFPKLLAEPRHQIGRRIHVVHKNIESALFCSNTIEHCLHLLVVVVIACNRDATTPEFIDLCGRFAHRARNRAGFNAAASHVDGESRRTQFKRDSLTNTATRSSHNSYTFSHHTLPLVSDELTPPHVLPPEYSMAKCTEGRLKQWFRSASAAFAVTMWLPSLHE